MSRAYICLARNDIDENDLQVLDLKPNTSQRNSIYEGQGQTGYLTWYRRNDTVAITIGGGAVTTDDVYYGVQAYVYDAVCDVTTTPGHDHPITSTVVAGLISTAILNRVAQGLSLTIAALNTIVDTYLTGSTFGTAPSLGTVADLLRILAGETYRLPAGATLGAAGTSTFHAALEGAFVIAPEVIQNLNMGPDGGPGVAYGLPVLPRTPVTQTGLHDTNFRNIRRVEQTPELDMSATDGVLSKLKPSTFDFDNPAFVYEPDTTTISVVGDVVVDEKVYINGIPFTAKAVPVAANQEFRNVVVAGSVGQTAITLRAAINHANGLALTGMTSPAITATDTVGILTVRQETGNQYWLQAGDPAHFTFGEYPTGAAQAAQGARLVSHIARAVTVYDYLGNVI